MIIKVTPDSYDGETIEVEISGDRRRLPAWAFSDHVYIAGLAVKYPTGKKVWPGRAIYWPASGRVNNLHARNMDHRVGSNYVVLVGYFADYANKAVRSQHKAVA